MRILSLILLIGMVPLTAAGQVFMSKSEALDLFLGASPVRKTLFLTDDQVRAVRQSSKADLRSKVITYYTGRNRTAFIETRTVRTMPATFMVVLDSASRVQHVELLAFYEPEDYLPPKRWLSTFRDKGPADDLWLKRGVHSIAGATLSAQAITESIRSIVTIHSTIIMGTAQ